MIDHLGPELMLLGLIAGIFSGYPVAFVLAGIGILFAVANGIPMLFLSMGVQRIYSGTLTNWLLVAIPLFVFMGLMLERSGIAERLMRSLASLFQRTPGGYAFSVMIIGVIMAASTGIIGASVVMMGMMSLPAMREAKYDMQLASGLIASSGTLGILLPPSIMLIILGDQLRVSVGDLFMGAIVPGLVLSGLYFLYLGAVAIFQPHRVPAPEVIERRSLGQTAWALTRDLLAPMLLILSVLGTIIAGIATPTESAAIGATGALLLYYQVQPPTQDEVMQTILDIRRRAADEAAGRLSETEIVARAAIEQGVALGWLGARQRPTRIGLDYAAGKGHCITIGPTLSGKGLAATDTLLCWPGSAVVIATGLFTFHHERRLARAG